MGEATQPGSLHSRDANVRMAMHALHSHESRSGSEDHHDDCLLNVLDELHHSDSHSLLNSSISVGVSE